MAKILFDSDSVAVLYDPDQGKVLAEIEGCTPPVLGGCSTAACFNFKPDTSEYEGGGASGYAFELVSCGWWPDYTTSEWVLDGVSSSVRLPFVGTIPDVQHSVVIAWIIESDDTVTNYMVVDGVESTHMNDPASLFDDGSGWVQFKVGSHFPDTIAHREISHLVIVSSDIANYPDTKVIDATGTTVVARVSPSSTISSSPPDTHTTFTGSTISFAGGVWRVDNDSATSVYAQFSFCPVTDCRPASTFRCCCSSVLALLSGITTIELDFTLTGLCNCGDISLTKTWNRVSIGTVPSDNEFRVLCVGDGRRATLDAGSSTGHGAALQIISNDVPFPSDFIEIDVPLGVFAGPPDFDQPICNWSIEPSITSGLTCVTPPSWDSTTVYPVNALVSYVGSVYISLQDGNVNKNPATQTDWWLLFSASPCDCVTSPNFSLDTTMFDLSAAAGVHTYTDTRTCGSSTYTSTWTLTLS